MALTRRTADQNVHRTDFLRYALLNRGERPAAFAVEELFYEGLPDVSAREVRLVHCNRVLVHVDRQPDIDPELQPMGCLSNTQAETTTPSENVDQSNSRAKRFVRRSR
jgi:hypothetical protein